MVEYFIKIERIKNIVPKNIFFLAKRKKERSTKKIITISLWPLTNVSIITSGLRANKIRGIIFFDSFQTRKTVRK